MVMGNNPTSRRSLQGDAGKGQVVAVQAPVTDMVLHLVVEMENLSKSSPVRSGVTFPQSSSLLSLAMTPVFVYANALASSPLVVRSTNRYPFGRTVA